jgi:hypothetical protein
MDHRTPRQRAAAQATVLEGMAVKAGTRSIIAANIVTRFEAYGLPPRERPKNALRALIWETSGERGELVRLLTAIYRHMPDDYATRGAGAPKRRSTQY